MIKPTFILISVIVFSTLATVSCTEVDNLAGESVSDTEETAVRFSFNDGRKSIGQTDAIEIARKILNKTSYTRSSYPSVSNVKGQNGNDCFYAVNFPEGGFAVISSSKDYYPIIAQSETGSFDVDNLPAPAKAWFDNQIMQASDAVNFSDSLKLSIKREWNGFSFTEKSVKPSQSTRVEGYPPLPQFYYDSLRNWSLSGKYKIFTLEEYKRTEEYQYLSDYDKGKIDAMVMYEGNSNYGPQDQTAIVLRSTESNITRTKLMQTEWAQYYPFNASVPGNFLLGCTTVAAGQIMYYHRCPIHYNWDAMPLKWNGAFIGFPTDDLPDFLYELARGIGVEFGIDASGATLDQVEHALSNYGYNVKTESHKENRVYDSLTGRNPVFMMGLTKNGNAHAWVCEGYNYMRTESRLSVMVIAYKPTTYPEPDGMIEATRIIMQHETYPITYYMNWGEGGDANGYYRDTDPSPNYGCYNPSYNFSRYNLYVTK